MNLLYRITERVARLDRLAALMTRLGLVGVTLWIGGVAVTHHATDRIVPFVSNSRFLRWLLTTPEGYERHRAAEGGFDASNVSWHHANAACPLSVMLGMAIVAIGVLIAVGFCYPAAGVIGGILLTGTSLVILSFLLATTGVWVAGPGPATRGVAFLAAYGRCAVKGAILLGVSLGCAADYAKQFVVKRGGPFGDAGLVRYWGP